MPELGVLLGCWIAMALAEHTQTLRPTDPCHPSPVENRSHLSFGGFSASKLSPPAEQRTLVNARCSWQYTLLGIV